MDKYKDEEYLVGIDGYGNATEIPNTLADVADFICANGIYGNLDIFSHPSQDVVLNTFGLYINKCPDQEYLNALLPVLIPKQHETEKKVFAEALEEAAEEGEELDEEEEMDR